MNLAPVLERKSIGKSLREMRLAAGLSQKEAARLAKMRPEVLCRLELGQGNPTIGTIERIVSAIGSRA
jgi:transcriptional regulator with XRE-family HTH domain